MIMPKNRKFFNVVAKSASEVDIYIYGPIGYRDWYEDSRDALEFVNEFKNLEKDYDRINIHINSAGGIISEGLPMFNVIKQSDKETHSYIDGIAYSMGAIIALAADTVHSAKNGLFLIHNASGWAWGNSKDLQETANELDKYDSSLITALIDKTGLTEDEVKENWFDYKDHLMTAQEAKENGFVDVIEEKEADLPDNIKEMNLSQVMNYLNTLSDNGDEQKFFDKVINQVKKALNINSDTQSKSLNKMNKEQLKKVALSVELKEDATFDEVFAKIKEINAAKTKAENDLQTETVAKETAERSLNKVTTALNDLGEDVTNAESPTDKVEAVRTMLAEKPSKSNSAGTTKKDDIDEPVDGVDQEAIDSLPHNKEADEALG